MGKPYDTTYQACVQSYQPTAVIASCGVCAFSVCEVVRVTPGRKPLLIHGGVGIVSTVSLALFADE